MSMNERYARALETLTHPKLRFRRDECKRIHQGTYPRSFDQRWLPERRTRNQRIHHHHPSLLLRFFPFLDRKWSQEQDQNSLEEQFPGKWRWLYYCKSVDPISSWECWNKHLTFARSMEGEPPVSKKTSRNATGKTSIALSYWTWC